MKERRRLYARVRGLVPYTDKSANAVNVIRILKKKKKSHFFQRSYPSDNFHEDIFGKPNQPNQTEYYFASHIDRKTYAELSKQLPAPSSTVRKKPGRGIRYHQDSSRKDLYRAFHQLAPTFTCRSMC